MYGVCYYAVTYHQTVLQIAAFLSYDVTYLNGAIVASHKKCVD